VNGIDVVILVVLLLGAVGGLRRGFILEIAMILGAIVALGVARAEYVSARHVLARGAPHSPWLTVIAYLIVFFVVWAVIIALARLARRSARFLMMGWVDRLGGLVVGILQSALLLELLLYLSKRIPGGELHHQIAHARLAPLFLDVVPYLDKLFPHVPK